MILGDDNAVDENEIKWMVIARRSMDWWLPIDRPSWVLQKGNDSRIQLSQIQKRSKETLIIGPQMLLHKGFFLLLFKKYIFKINIFKSF